MQGRIVQINVSRGGVPIVWLEVHRRAPSDRRQRRLEVLAERRLFQAPLGCSELDSLTRHALVLWIHDSWVGRARYATVALGRRGLGGWTRVALRVGSARTLRHAWRLWRPYRRAIARVVEATDD